MHAKFGLDDPSSSLGGEWRQTDRQTVRHTFLFKYRLPKLYVGQFLFSCYFLGWTPPAAMHRGGSHQGRFLHQRENIEP